MHKKSIKGAIKKQKKKKTKKKIREETKTKEAKEKKIREETNEKIVIFNKDDVDKRNINREKNQIPFKIYFVKGTSIHNEKAHTFDFVPVGVFIGDYDNILYLRNLMSVNYEEKSLKELSYEYTTDLHPIFDYRSLKCKDNTQIIYEDEIDENDSNYIEQNNYIPSIRTNTTLTLPMHPDIYTDTDIFYTNLDLSLENNTVQALLSIINYDIYDNFLFHTYVFNKHKLMKTSSKYYSIDEDDKMYFNDKQKKYIVSKLIKDNTIDKIREKALTKDIDSFFTHTNTITLGKMSLNDFSGDFILYEVHGIINM